MWPKPPLVRCCGQSVLPPVQSYLESACKNQAACILRETEIAYMDMVVHSLQREDIQWANVTRDRRCGEGVVWSVLVEEQAQSGFGNFAPCVLAFVANQREVFQGLLDILVIDNTIHPAFRWVVCDNAVTACGIGIASLALLSKDHSELWYWISYLRTSIAVTDYVIDGKLLHSDFISHAHFGAVDGVGELVERVHDCLGGTIRGCLVKYRDISSKDNVRKAELFGIWLRDSPVPERQTPLLGRVRPLLLVSCCHCWDNLVDHGLIEQLLQGVWVSMFSGRPHNIATYLD